MTHLGMDVEHVEVAARSLQGCATDIDALVLRIDSIVSRVPGVWEGPKAQEFVQEWWPTKRRMLAAASSHVAGLGRSALANASEQREASGGGGNSSLTIGVEGAVGGSAVQSAADRYKLTRAAGDDGVRIQGVRGADGVLRYVVYIDGTNSSWVGDHGILENVAEIGIETDTYRNIRGKMESLIQPPGSEVMVVGYSQGGILAQHLAGSNQFNITDVLTYGSPYYSNGDSTRQYNIVRIRDDGDTIPTSDPGYEKWDMERGNLIEDLTDKAATALRSLLGDDAGAVQHEVDRINKGEDLTYRTQAGTSGEWAGPLYIGNHAKPETYEHGGNQFEAEALGTPEGRRVLESQSRFTGEITSDSDDRDPANSAVWDSGSNTWTARY